jgi:hypothetical protein
LQSLLKQPPAATPTRHTLPNISPSTTKPYQTLGPSSAVQHLRYRRPTVAALPCALWPCVPRSRPSTLLLYRSRCSAIIITTTCQHIRHLQRTLPPPYRESSLPVALVRGDITCPGVCTCVGYTTAADRGANAERLSATPSWRSPRSRQDKTRRPFELLQRACCTWDKNSFWFSPQKVLFHLFFASSLTVISHCLPIFFSSTSFVSATSTLDLRWTLTLDPLKLPRSPILSDTHPSHTVRYDYTRHE